MRRGTQARPERGGALGPARGEEREQGGARVVLEVIGHVGAAEGKDVEEAERREQDPGEEQHGRERAASDAPAPATVPLRV